MSDNREALESVLLHAAQGHRADHDDIEATVHALAGSGDVALLPRLHDALDRFLHEENPAGRDVVAALLAGLAGPPVLPDLIVAAARGQGDLGDQDGLWAVIAGLLELDPAAGRRRILDLARSTVPHRRRAGLSALGAMVDPGDVAVLAEAATDTDPAVRLAAVQAIPGPGNDPGNGSDDNGSGNDPGNGSDDNGGGEQAFQVIVVALRDPDEAVRLAAISRLGAIKRPDAVAPLTAAAADPSPLVRARVAYALGRIGGAVVTPVLLGLLEDADQDVRDRAREALGSTGVPDAVDALITQAADPDPRQRAQAAKALARTAGTDPRAEARVRLLAQDDAPDVRAAVLSGLATVADGSDRWVPLVTALADDPDKGVRHRVAFVVHHLAPHGAVDLLHHLAADPSGFVREAAAAQLARLGPRAGTYGRR